MADSSAEGGAARLFGRLGCAIKGIRGPPKTELERLLDSVTRTADGIDLDQAALEGVVRFCAEEADRRTIMRHVHSCLAEPQSSQWRCVYLGLQVLEHLFGKGPPELVTEAATGAHFDVAHRLSFLEKYEMGTDVRVQNLIRRRAAAMKADWLQRQAGEELGGGNSSQEAKTPATRSTKSCSTAFSRASDDAGGSSDEDPGGRPAPSAKAGGAYSSDPRVHSQGRRPMEDSTDDEDDGKTKRQAEPRRAAVTKKPSPPAPEVDLMGLMDDPVAAAAAEKPAPAPAASVDLLGEGGSSSSDSKFLDPAGPDWLEKAQAHGLYSKGAPGERDLLSAARPAPPAEASLIDF